MSKNNNKDSGNGDEKSKTKSIATFFLPLTNSKKTCIAAVASIPDTNSSKMQCNYCLDWYVSNGFVGHVRWHIVEGHVLADEFSRERADQRRKPTGKVKVTGVPYKRERDVVEDEEVQDQALDKVDDPELKEPPKKRLKGSHWSVQERLEILDHLHNVANDNKEKTARWVKTVWTAPNFDTKSLRDWLPKEATLRASTGKQYHSQCAPGVREGT